jgi:hypothetical protein
VALHFRASNPPKLGFMRVSEPSRRVNCRRWVKARQATARIETKLLPKLTSLTKETLWNAANDAGKRTGEWAGLHYDKFLAHDCKAFYSKLMVRYRKLVPEDNQVQKDF